jgi:hypothetical protein
MLDRTSAKPSSIWDLAHRCVTNLAAKKTPEVRQPTVDSAVARGMFSIRWTAFAADADMRRRLRQAFRGTCPNSFDANEPTHDQEGNCD